MKKMEKTLYELVKDIIMFPQVLKNVEITEKRPLENISGLNKMVEGYTNNLGNKGRINIRYSGTEPLARVMVEGEDISIINTIASDISNLLQQEIG